MSAPRTRSAQAYRLLLAAYPREQRGDFGDEMVQLVQDRQVLGGEPLWHLWPLLLADTTVNAGKARWNVVVTKHRAMVLGALVTVSVLALVSDGLGRGMPVVVGAAGVGWFVWRGREAVEHAGPSPRSRAWFVASALLLGTAIAILVALGDQEASELQWIVLFGTLVSGVFALTTAVLLQIGGDRWTRPPRGPSGRSWAGAWFLLAGSALLASVPIAASLGVEAWFLGMFVVALGAALVVTGLGTGVVHLARRPARG